MNFVYINGFHRLHFQQHVPAFKSIYGSNQVDPESRISLLNGWDSPGLEGVILY
jgi:hypothetical protein